MLGGISCQSDRLADHLVTLFLAVTGGPAPSSVTDAIARATTTLSAYRTAAALDLPGLASATAGQTLTAAPLDGIGAPVTVSVLDPVADHVELLKRCVWVMEAVPPLLPPPAALDPHERNLRAPLPAAAQLIAGLVPAAWRRVFDFAALKAFCARPVRSVAQRL